MKSKTTFAKLRNAASLTVGLALLCASTAQAQTAGTFALNQQRSRLVVLIHGVTSEPAQAPDEYINTSRHARSYWGFDFIKGLQGRTDETKMQVITPLLSGSMRFHSTTASEWVPTTTDTNPFDQAPICFPVSWYTNLPAGIETNTSTIRSYINLMAKNKGAEETMVMVNTHDGSKHFMTQLGETIDQIYRSYTIAFGWMAEADQPQIYLVGHSFGGVLARGILANPTGADLFGKKLTATQRTRADYLRKRVVLVQTLATPHEGTFVQDPSSDFADYVTQNGYGIIFNALQTYDKFEPGKNRSVAQLKDDTKKIYQSVLDAIAGKRDCLADLTRMNEYNNGILAPSTAVREPGGPLVPIYTAGGRNPGAHYFDKSRRVFGIGSLDDLQWNPITSLDLMTKNSRFMNDSAKLNLIEGLFHAEGYGKEGKKPYGTATNPQGDRVKGPWAGYGPTYARPVSAGWTPNAGRIADIAVRWLYGNPYTFGVGDGEWDNDGFLGWDSAMGYHLNAPNFYRVYDQNMYGTMLPWDNDNHSTIRFNTGVGQWIHNELIRKAGPYIVYPGTRRSSWSIYDVPTIPKTNMEIKVLSVQDIANDLDFFTQADFQLKVTVGSNVTTRNLADDTKLVTTIAPFTYTGLVGTVIPIKIESVDRDTPDPNDTCVMSPATGKSSIYLYVDTRTGRITGDATGVVGQDLTLRPLWVAPLFWDVENKIQTKLRITLSSTTPEAAP